MQKPLKLFQKIEITESTRQTKPGSIGYVVYINELAMYNMLDVRIMFTKFGKSGKKRFSVARVKVPMVDIDCLQIAERSKKTLKTLPNKELMPRMSVVEDSKIKVIQESSKNLTEIDTWDFMAYISAISMFLDSHRMIYGRPVNANNININDLELQANDIGALIYKLFRSKALNPKLDMFVEYFDNVDNRRTWMDKLRKEISVNRQIITITNESVLRKYGSNYELIRIIARKIDITMKKISIKEML